MRLHRFFINDGISGGKIRVKGGELVRQWRDVLRLKSGAEVFIFDGSGIEAKAKITDLSKNGAELEVKEIFKNENEAVRRVILYCSVLKRENFELVAQKATEVGVAEIVPIIAERTEKLNLRVERLEKIIKEAAEQSGRAIVPRLREPVKFEDAVREAREIYGNLFFNKTGHDIKNGPFATSPKSFAVWVGPEGGWTEGEIRIVKEAGFKIASLGKLTLRAETAAIVASYVAVWYSE